MTPIGGLAVVAFWRSPHGPLDSGPPRAGYSQRRKRKKREKREKEERKKKKEKEKKRKKEKRRKGRRLETDMGQLFCV